MILAVWTGHTKATNINGPYSGPKQFKLNGSDDNNYMIIVVIIIIIISIIIIIISNSSFLILLSCSPLVPDPIQGLRL